MNILDLAQKKVKLRKVSSTNGGEWQGPCPGCGGNDRFHVWPGQNQGEGSYWCRGCGKAGDTIQFLRDFEGMSFQEACDYLNIDVPDQPRQFGPAQRRIEPVEFTPAEHQSPTDLWQTKAEALVVWAQGQLLKNAEVLSWLAARGIDRAAAERYRLGWNPGEKGKDLYRARTAWGLPVITKDNGRPRVLWIPRGLVIPVIIDGTVHRVRIRRPEGEPRYYVIPGSSAHIMHLEPQRRAAVIVESELDAVAVVANNQIAGAVAVGTSHGKPDAVVYESLKGSLQILNALDFDKAGSAACRWWDEHFDQNDRWPVSRGKDPGEAYELGIDLDCWIKAGLAPALIIDDKQAAPATSHIPAPEPAKPEARVLITGTGSLHPAVRELYQLLQNNPSVVIINEPARFTILRHGKYVGGRINQLVFQVPEVTDYILAHPADRIDGTNLIPQTKEEQ